MLEIVLGFAYLLAVVFIIEMSIPCICSSSLCADLEAAVLPLTPQMSLKCDQQCEGCNHCWELCDWVLKQGNAKIGASKKEVLRALSCACTFVIGLVFVIGEEGPLRRWEQAVELISSVPLSPALLAACSQFVVAGAKSEAGNASEYIFCLVHFVSSRKRVLNPAV